MTLNAYQLQMPNGTILGAGTGVELNGITGLLDKPALRMANAPRGQRDGSVPGLNFVGERVVDVVYQITAIPSGTTPETYRALAVAAHQNVSDPSTVCLSGGDYLRQVAGIGAVKPVYAVQVQLPNRAGPLAFFGRPVKYSTAIDQNFSHGQVTIASEWNCTDGLLYDYAPVSSSTGLANPTSGMTFPSTFPMTFGASTGGGFQLNNTGTYQANPFFVIQGPCNTPTIYNNATGQQIQLNIALSSTDVITIDVQSGVVTLNGTANRNNILDISSYMFTLPPGISSIGFGSIDSIAVAATLTGYLLPTYETI